MLDTTRGIGLDKFLQRLAETIDWCAPRALMDQPKRSLRTPRLAPKPLAGDRVQIVESVCHARHCGLGWPAARLAKSLQGGRLLGYAPDDNLSDCAAKEVSYGYFDCDNVPPWDTWIGYIYETERCNYLVSWVAPCFIEWVSHAILVNPEECIWWLSDRNTELSAVLKRHDGS